MAERYVKGQLLGKGSFGAAYLVTCKADGQKYVLKEIDISRMQRSEREAAEQEAKVLQALHHPNVVSCKEAFVSGGKLCILMDYCSEGDLANALKKRNGATLPEAVLLDWFVQLCLGLKHVHDRKILHRDIKSQNVFMSAGGLLKLGDFGVSKVLSSTMQLAKTGVGTPYYLSPEICQNRGYNAKSDVWSLGCVLYEMATLRHPFDAPNMRQLATKIVRGSYLPIASTYSKGLKDLVDMTLRVDPKRRPTVNEVLKMPVLQERIAKFLSATVRAAEFSHTVIHKGGGLSKAPLAGGVPGGIAAGAKSPMLAAKPTAAAPRPLPGLPGGGVPRPVPSAVPSIAARANAAAKAPAAKWSPRPPIPSPGAARISASPRPSNGGGRRSPRPAAGGRVSPHGQLSPAGGRASPISGRVSPVGQGPSPAKVVADAHAAQVQRQKALAAQQAQRQQARVGLEQERERLTQEAKQLEAARQKLAREQKKRQEADGIARMAAQRKAAQQAAEQQAQAQAKADLEQKRAERQAREAEREQERQAMRAAKQEWQLRQMEAFRNRKQVESDRTDPLPRPSPIDAPPVYAPSAPRRPVLPSEWQQGYADRQAEPRMPSQRSPASRSPSSKGIASPAAAPSPPRQLPAGGPTAEERRQIYNEMREAAERNRRAVRGDYGMPDPPRAAPADNLRTPPAASPPLSRDPSPSPSRHVNAVGSASDPTAEQRRQIWEEMRAAAERNRQQITGQPPRSRPSSRPVSRPVSPPQSQPSSRPPSRPPSRPHSPPRPSLDPVQAMPAGAGAAARVGLPPRAHPGGGLPSGRGHHSPAPASTNSPTPDLQRPVVPLAAAPANVPVFNDQPMSSGQPNAAFVQKSPAVAQQAQYAQQAQNNQQPQQAQRDQQAQQAQRDQQPQQAQRDQQLQQAQHDVRPSALQQVQQQQPALPAAQELTHVIDFMNPEAESVLHHKEFAAPSAHSVAHTAQLAQHSAAHAAQRTAELQREGPEGGSGGSLEGESVMQPIPVMRSAEQEAAEEEDYGQMVQELQQVLDTDDTASSSDAGDTDEQAGKFILDGEEVDLGVGPQASMAQRVEALRVLLEQRLGLDIFMKVYKRLESIPTTHDEQEEKMAAELAELLGPERMPWLQLVHQLIVSEEVMQAEQ